MAEAVVNSVLLVLVNMHVHGEGVLAASDSSHSYILVVQNKLFLPLPLRNLLAHAVDTFDSPRAVLLLQ